MNLNYLKFLNNLEAGCETTEELNKIKVIRDLYLLYKVSCRDYSSDIFYALADIMSELSTQFKSGTKFEELAARWEPDDYVMEPLEEQSSTSSASSVNSHNEQSSRVRVCTFHAR